MQQSTSEWTRDTWIAEDADQRTLWEGALPFAGLDNGDFLALDVRTAAEDPAVVYLSHDDESRILTPTFTTFLAAWEALCYIGPEIWLLQEFAGADGVLDSIGTKAREWRSIIHG